MSKNKFLFFLFIFLVVTATFIALESVAQAQQAQKASAQQPAQEQFVYDAKGRRNPFIPLIGSDGRILQLDKEERATQDLVVDGIIYDKFGRSYAIVNGEVASVGDRIGVYRVLKIEKNKVIFLNKDGQAREVELYKEGE